MRRSDREVTKFSDIIAIIEKCDVCRLALNDEDYPYILPLNFGINITEDNNLEHYHMEHFPFNKAVMPRTTVYKLVVEHMTGKIRLKRNDKH